MKTLLALALFVAVPLVAQTPPPQFTYIMPVYGAARGVDADFEALVTVTNLGKTEATVRIGEIFSAGNCQAPVTTSFKLAAGDTRLFIELFCSGLAAFTFLSDQPLSITNDIVGKSFSPANLETRQGIAVRSEWLPGNRTFIFTNIEIETVGDNRARANLFLVNPNATPINVSVTTRRPTATVPRYNITSTVVTVPAKSLLVHSLAQAEEAGTCDIAQLCNVNHQVLVNSSAQFYAGVSSLRFVHGYWRDPLLLQ
ncbi:MAG TPA: hypothetical protein VGF69_12360 [Thermoanaerobaculia bacterium]|jgi:hypothetical protein